MEFTTLTLKGVTKTGKRYTITDSTRQGLVLRVSATGKGSYYYRYKAQGQRIEEPLYGHWEQVLESYEYHSNKVKRPAMTESIRPDQLFINSSNLPMICRKYLDEYATRLAGSTQKNYEYFLQRLLDHTDKSSFYHGRCTIFEAQHDVRLLLKRIRDVDNKPILCNRMKSCFSSMFKWATEEELVTQNPIHSMPTAPEKPQTRRLSDTNIRAFETVLKEGIFEDTTKDALRLILLTGMRSGEVLNITPSMIEGDALLLPGRITKNNQELMIPLSDKALALLTANCKGKGAEYRIFQLSAWGLRQVCVRACKRAATPKCTPHDLRRTFATMCGFLGHDTPLIGKLLNHASVGVTSRHYALYESAKEKRQAVTDVARHLATLGLI